MRDEKKRDVLTDLTTFECDKCGKKLTGWIPPPEEVADGYHLCNQCRDSVRWFALYQQQQQNEQQ